MKFKYEILYTDGMGNPRRWGITTDYVKAERSLARLRTFMGIPYLGYIKRLGDGTGPTSRRPCTGS